MKLENWRKYEKFIWIRAKWAKNEGNERKITSIKRKSHKSRKSYDFGIISSFRVHCCVTFFSFFQFSHSFILFFFEIIPYYSVSLPYQTLCWLNVAITVTHVTSSVILFIPNWPDTNQTNVSVSLFFKIQMAKNLHSTLSLLCRNTLVCGVESLRMWSSRLWCRQTDFTVSH